MGQIHPGRVRLVRIAKEGFRYPYERLKLRLGHKRAIIAVAHSMAPVVFQVLSTPLRTPNPAPIPT